MESGLLLDVVVRKSAAILELLSGEDETLLIRGNTFLVLNLLLYSLDGVRSLNLKGDGLSGQGLDEDLHICSVKSFFGRLSVLLNLGSFNRLILVVLILLVDFLFSFKLKSKKLNKIIKVKYIYSVNGLRDDQHPLLTRSLFR